MALNWNRGVLEGFDKLLSDDEKAMIETAILGYRAHEYSVTVSSAGREIANSLESETHTPRFFLESFQEAFIQIFREARSGRSQSLCCIHHTSELQQLAKDLSDEKVNWINSLLDLLPAVNPNLLADLPSQMPSLPASISRFMSAKAFLEVHIRHPRANALTEAGRLLHPNLTKGVRMAALKSKMLGRLRGRIGTFPNIHGISALHHLDCDRVRAFATFTDSVTRAVGGNRTTSPDVVLRALGIPFEKNQYWIEIQLLATDVGIEYSDADVGDRLAVPTISDARGNWAFRPLRDNPPVHGYARNLLDNSKGLPEILYMPLDAMRLYDAIMWSTPTATTWNAGTVFS